MLGPPLLMAISAGGSFWKIAKGESEFTLPQMTWLLVSIEVVTSTHALFSKWNRWSMLGSPNCAGVYVMQTLTGGP